MHTCDELGEEIEKHLRGAADADESARVAEHLAGCASCRDFVAQARRIETELHGALEQPTEVDARWRQVRAFIQGRRRSMRTAWLCAGCAFALALPVRLLSDGNTEQQWTAALGLVIIGVILSVAALYLRHELRRNAERTERELLTWTRERTRRERRGAFSAAVLFGGLALLELGAWIIHRHDRDAVLCVAGVGIHLGLLFICLRRLRQLARELQVLA